MTAVVLVILNGTFAAISNVCGGLAARSLPSILVVLLGAPGAVAIATGAALIDGSRPDALDPAAPPDATISEALGIQTNNVAEWTGVVEALRLAHRLGAEKVDLFLDSKLIVEQLHGRWRVKDAKLQPLHAEAKSQLGRFRRWSATHVPRAQNSTADRLANEALDRVAVGGPARVARARRVSPTGPDA